MAILRKAQNSGTSSQRIDMSGLDETCWFLENLKILSGLEMGEIQELLEMFRPNPNFFFI